MYAESRDLFTEAADRETANSDVAHLADHLTGVEVDLAKDADAVYLRRRTRIEARSQRSCHGDPLPIEPTNLPEASA